ncbi:MAG: hypothetical protein QOE26_1036 [Verrucomicrobiota bacterium]|jgi:hypothetical protein
MNNSRLFRFILSSALVAGFSSVGFAQATRTWVSGVGNDANPCSRTAPCKTFAGAISKTAEGGEIDVLDAGGFGAVTITKAMTIDGTHGSGFGSVLNSGTNGINVNISASGLTHPNDAVVILRSLSIQGASQAISPGLSGINFTRGDRLFVHDCHFQNQNTAGIAASLTSAGALFVRDCDFENTNTAIKGTTTAGKILMDVTNISVHGNANGVQYLANAQGSITNSFFSKNTGESVGVGATCVANVTHCHFRGNNIGVSAAAGAQVRVNENELFDNNNGFQGTAVAFQSGGNNKLAGNTANVTPTGAPLLTQ